LWTNKRRIDQFRLPLPTAALSLQSNAADFDNYTVTGWKCELIIGHQEVSPLWRFAACLVSPTENCGRRRRRMDDKKRRRHRLRRLRPSSSWVKCPRVKRP